jgi:TRAP-type C4-dicarboxylate transport system permease small subunit
MKYSMKYTTIIGEAAGGIAACLLACLVIFAVGAVLCRYLFHAPIAWAEEVESLGLLWIIMIGAIYAKKRNTLLRMDILYLMLPPAARRCAAIFQELAHCAVFCLMIVYGYRLALQVYDKGTSLLNIPLYWLYLSLPVGACGMLLVTLAQLGGMICGKGDDQPWD